LQWSFGAWGVLVGFLGLLIGLAGVVIALLQLRH